MSIGLLGEVLGHPTEEQLEEYCFGRVREPALTALEEHLLVCETCQDRLEELEEYAAFMKSALAAFEESRPGQSAVRSWFRPLGWNQTGAVLAVGLVFAIVSGALWWRSGPIPQTATVQLTAFRGGDSAFSTAPSRRPLDLTVDSASLPPTTGYTLEMVSQNGRTVWTSEARLTGTRLSAHVSSGPRKGIYWVRLYNSQGTLLREFGLRLE